MRHSASISPRAKQNLSLHIRQDHDVVVSTSRSLASRLQFEIISLKNVHHQDFDLIGHKEAAGTRVATVAKRHVRRGAGDKLFRRYVG